MADLDDLQVVGAEGDGDGAADGEQGVDAQGEHQEPGTQQRDEEVSGGATAQQQEIIDLLRPVALRGRVDGGRGHAAEHGLRPGRLVAGVRGVPFHHLVRHSLPAGDVALVDDFAAQHLGYISIRQDEQADNDAGIQEEFLLHLKHFYKSGREGAAGVFLYAGRLRMLRVEEGQQFLSFVPVEHLAGGGVTQHGGCCAVFLADAQHGTPGSKVFKNLAWKDFGVLGFATKW